MSGCKGGSGGTSPHSNMYIIKELESRFLTSQAEYILLTMQISGYQQRLAEFNLMVRVITNPPSTKVNSISEVSSMSCIQGNALASFNISSVDHL